MTNDEVGVGIIGCGWAGLAHAMCYAQFPNVKIIAFADPVEGKAKEYAKKYGAETWFRDYEALLKRSDVDAISVCVPPFLHSKVTIDAAEAGIKYILCEKPLSLTIEDCDKSIEAAKKNRANIQVGFYKRFMPAFVKAKEILDSGDIGDPVRIYYRWHTNKHYLSKGWRLDPSKSGGFTVDWCAHGCDLLPWYFGKVDEIYSHMEALVKGIPNSATEDNVTVLFKFENGGMGTLEGSCSGTYRFPGREALNVLASKGGFYLNPHVGYESMLRITLYNDERRISEYVNPLTPYGTGEYYWEFKDFIDCILNGEKPKVTGEDGRFALEVALAALESSKTGKPVKMGSSRARASKNTRMVEMKHV